MKNTNKTEMANPSAEYSSAEGGALPNGKHTYQIEDYSIESTKFGHPMLKLSLSIDGKLINIPLFEKTIDGRFNQQTRSFLLSHGIRNLVDFSFQDHFSTDEHVGKKGIVHLTRPEDENYYVPLCWEKSA